MNRYLKAISFVMMIMLILSMYSGYTYAGEANNQSNGNLMQSFENGDEIRSGSAIEFALVVTKVASNTNPSVGDEVTYTITVTNVGTQHFRKLEVIDEKLGLYETRQASCQEIWQLLSGESISFSKTMTMTTPGAFVNTVTVKGYFKQFVCTDLFPWELKASATANCLVNVQETEPEKQPELTVTKEVNKNSVFAGDRVVFTVVIENTGDVDFEDVYFEDSKLPYLKGFLGGLDVGESHTIIYEAIMLGEEMPEFTNDVLAFAWYNDQKVIATDQAIVTVNNPLVVTKSGVYTAYEGDVVSFDIEIGNIGNVALSDVLVTDSDSNGDTYEIGEIDYLEAKTTTTMSISIAMPETAGDYVNNAYAIGHLSNTKSQVSDFDDWTVEVISKQIEDPEAALSITKEASKNIAFVGEVVDFVVVIENTGDVDLEHVYFEDSRFPFMNGNIGYLAVDEPWTIYYSMTLNADDMPTFTNVVTASAFDNEITATDVETVSLINPLIVTKSGVYTAFTDEVVAFNIQVGNAGSVILYDVEVTDTDSEGNTYSLGIIPYLEPLNVSIMAINVTMPGIVGNYVNTASAIGWYYDYGNAMTSAYKTCLEKNRVYLSATDAWIVNVVDENEPSYGIDVEKTVDKASVYVDDTVKFTIKVTNTGNRTMQEIRLIDEKLDIDAVIASLEPNKTYSTESAIKMTTAGTYVNTATATAVIYKGEIIVEDADTATVNVSNRGGGDDPEPPDPDPDPPEPPIPPEDQRSQDNNIILDIPIPFSAPTLPQTGGVGIEFLYGLSVLSAGLSIAFRRRR